MSASGVQAEICSDRIIDNRNQSESKYFEDELAKLKEENESLKKGKDELLTRLSALASARLTDVNLNIADLSDVNRPTKLAEQYSELFDNEWTDAFDVLSCNGETEEAACRILLESFCHCISLQLIHNTCSKKAKVELYNVIDGIKIFLGNQDPPVDVLKLLKDRRKRNSLGKTNCKKLKQEIKSGLKEILHSKRIRKDKKMESFLDKSIKLCWLMVVQDPPVFVDTNIKRCGEIFDSNELKAYTKSGFYIDYIVWAPLYLVKGGNLLCKGVAQCKTETSYSILPQINLKEKNDEKMRKDKLNDAKTITFTSNVSHSTKMVVLPMTTKDEKPIEIDAGAVLEFKRPIFTMGR